MEGENVKGVYSLSLINCGKTAVIRFDEFDEMAVNLFICAFQRLLPYTPTHGYNDDPSTPCQVLEGMPMPPNGTDYSKVENILIDLSYNTGGAANVLYAMLTHLVYPVKFGLTTLGPKLHTALLPT